MKILITIVLFLISINVFASFRPLIDPEVIFNLLKGYAFVTGLVFVSPAIGLFVQCILVIRTILFLRKTRQYRIRFFLTLIFIQFFVTCLWLIIDLMLGLKWYGFSNSIQLFLPFVFLWIVILSNWLTPILFKKINFKKKIIKIFVFLLFFPGCIIGFKAFKMFQYSNEVGKRLDKLREDSSNLNRSDNLKCHRYISLYCSDENTNKLGFFIHYTFSKDYYNNQTCEFSDETVGVEYWKFIDAEMLWASEIIKNKYPDLVKNCTHTSMWRIISRPKKSGYLNKLNAIQDLDNDIENHCMKAENYYTSCEYSGDHIF